MRTRRRAAVSDVLLSSSSIPSEIPRSHSPLWIAAGDVIITMGVELFASRFELCLCRQCWH